MTQADFREVCKAATYAFWETGELPTPRTVVKYIAVGNRNLTELAKTMSSPEFTEFLRIRGISNTGTLDERQLLALQYLTDLSSDLTLRGKLRKIGVQWWEYQAWLKHPEFANRLRGWADTVMDDAIPLAKVAVATQAANGKLDSIKYLMELTGVHDPARRQALDVQRVIAAVMESLMRHSTDLKLLKAVAEDIRDITKVNGLPQAAPGSYAVIDSPAALEEA
jgi:hypothetical protein